MDMSKDLVAASATPLVLAILTEGDSYGYAIIRRVAELGQAATCSGLTVCSIPCCTASSAKVMSRRSGLRPESWPQAQVLPDYQRRPGAARSATGAVAGRGQHSAGDLDAGVHNMTTFADQPLE